MKLQALPKAKMLLLAMAVIGLVSASFIPMAIAHDPTEKGLKPDGAHALSRTFPDVAPGEEVWYCSSLIFPDPPKDPPDGPCDQSNPSWVTGTWTGVASVFYYDLQRTRVKVDECNGFSETVDTGLGEKVGIAKCGTKITQSALLGFGSPNTFIVQAGDARWELNTCKSQHAVFQPSGVKLIGPPPDPALPAEATWINCHQDGDDQLPKTWNTPVNVTAFLGPGPWTNSINTGFQRPTVEEVVTEQSKKPSEQPFYIASTLFVDHMEEWSTTFPPEKKASHYEFRLGGNSCIDSHDWFLVLAGPPDGSGKPSAESWNEAVERHEVYDLSGSDVQGTAENQRPWGPGKTDEFSNPANPHDPKTSRPDGGCNDSKE